jgi:hypothetical protein
MCHRPEYHRLHPIRAVALILRVVFRKDTPTLAPTLAGKEGRQFFIQAQQNNRREFTEVQTDCARPFPFLYLDRQPR